ncbi:MAG: alkaline phosphatase [Saprospiraceae bacterium]
MMKLWLSYWATSLILYIPAILPAQHTVPDQQAGSQAAKLIDPLQHRDEPLARNVILMIGDGMGITQITAGMYASQQPLNLERCPVVGLIKTTSAQKLITDSAAGATAFSCGVKTKNGVVGMSHDLTPCTTILEEAESKGLATGIVTTSTVVHATPASFVAHQPSRNNMEEIAGEILKTEIDLLIGGGKKYFDRRSDDERNLIAEMEANGYIVQDYFNHEFDRIVTPPFDNFVFFTADSDPLPASQGRSYLPTAASMAPEFLKAHTQKGFFLMIEGGQIDWGGHANDADYIISEMIDFDKAIGQVLDFAEQDGETLVIITADHETGGFAINPGSTSEKMVTAFTSDYHTAVMVPVFAFGPGAHLFNGIRDNTQIFHLMRKALGFLPLQPQH